MWSGAGYRIKSWLEKTNKQGHLGGSVGYVVKRLALDLSSEHDLTVCEIEPRIGLCADGLEPAWDSLSPSLSLPLPPLSLSLSLSK